MFMSAYWQTLCFKDVAKILKIIETWINCIEFLYYLQERVCSKAT